MVCMVFESIINIMCSCIWGLAAGRYTRVLVGYAMGAGTAMAWLAAGFLP